MHRAPGIPRALSFQRDNIKHRLEACVACGDAEHCPIGSSVPSSLIFEPLATGGVIGRAARTDAGSNYVTFLAASASATAVRMSATENGLLMTSWAMALRLEARSRCAA